MTRSRKPSVFQVGKIRDDGRTVVISGWGLGLCAQGCACHRHPSAGHLAIEEDQAGGRSASPASARTAATAASRGPPTSSPRSCATSTPSTSLQAQEPLAG